MLSTKKIKFDTRIIFRLTDKERTTAQDIVNKNREKYYNLSHFVRVAVIRQIRFEENKFKKELRRIKKRPLIKNLGVDDVSKT
ncbi:MAG: hypothetical protein ACOC1P_00585 [Minisyncoccales bacterium]